MCVVGLLIAISNELVSNWVGLESRTSGAVLDTGFTGPISSAVVYRDHSYSWVHWSGPVTWIDRG